MNSDEVFLHFLFSKESLRSPLLRDWKPLEQCGIRRDNRIKIWSCYSSLAMKNVHNQCISLPLKVAALSMPHISAQCHWPIIVTLYSFLDSLHCWQVYLNFLFWNSKHHWNFWPSEELLDDSVFSNNWQWTSWLLCFPSKSFFKMGFTLSTFSKHPDDSR